LDQKYVTKKKMPNYLLRKVKQGQIAAHAANIALDAFNPKTASAVDNQATEILRSMARNPASAVFSISLTTSCR
jgi:hypothetical protein